MKSERIYTLLITLFLSLYTFAQPTKVIVRAKAKDAKFIGTGIGGAYIVIRNDLTGEILAKGLTTGASGNTDLIMKTPYTRNLPLTDEKTAKFETLIDIKEPTFVTIEAIAPVNRKSAAVTASTQLWLIPGKAIDGEGVVLEIPGFILDILEPQTHQVIQIASLKNNQVKIKINLVMMCGCVINKGGIWNADNIDVKALVKKDGTPQNEVVLKSIQDNIFEGLIPVSDKGNYEIQVYAYDKVTKNTGVDKINFVIQ
ncbi:hypothetical protein QNI19_30205 [Cytophagaceae bacterium DM2B3-1]|uniref:Uncharacterized protein n=1 Tax=Xanthocytophaga flava TaxID=3048013 RepID=A0ABT7CTZ8_9BACT|nr:hypothetical protein [Xanthocytophaga flavus]MDJ1497250.1 hypothetical protein [Xanthocytophaga flavus]